MAKQIGIDNILMAVCAGLIIRFLIDFGYITSLNEAAAIGVFFGIFLSKSS